jgi:hypothetical protein
MCTVSMIGDHYRDRWNERDYMQGWGTSPNVLVVPQISRQEFDELKREVTEMKELLRRAKKYDEDNGEPDCEIDEKMDLLRKVAKLVGVELDDVIGPAKS